MVKSRRDLRSRIIGAVLLLAGLPVARPFWSPIVRRTSMAPGRRGPAVHAPFNADPDNPLNPADSVENAMKAPGTTEPWMASVQASTRTTKAIMRTSNPAETTALLFARSREANHYTLCAALCRIAQQAASATGRGAAPAGRGGVEARQHARAVLDVLLQPEVLARLTARQLSNLGWSTAKLRLKRDEVRVFVDALGGRLERGANARFGEVSMAFWGAATVKATTTSLERGFALWGTDSLPKILAAASESRGAKAPKGKDVALLVWSLARLGRPVEPEVVAQLSELAAMMLETKRFSQKDMAMLLWGFGTLLDDDWRHETAVIAVVRHLVRKVSLSALGSRDLAQILNGLARARYDDTDLLLALGRSARLPQLLRRATPQELSTLLYCYARMYVLSAPFFRATAAELQRRGLATSIRGFDAFNNQELANVAWALTVLPLGELTNEGVEPVAPVDPASEASEHRPLQIWDAVRAHALEAAASRDDLLARHKRQLYQVYFSFHPPATELADFVDASVAVEIDDDAYERPDGYWFDLDVPSPAGAANDREMPSCVVTAWDPSTLDRDFVRRLRQEWREEKGRVKTSSARHASVSHALHGLGILHDNEMDEDADITIPSLGIALEMDGPDHYSRNTLRMLGHTHLKYRMLRQKGWRVVQIPWFEFDKIPFWSSMERKRFVQRKIGLQQTIIYSAKDYSTYRPYPKEGQTSRVD